MEKAQEASRWSGWVADRSELGVEKREREDQPLSKAILVLMGFGTHWLVGTGLGVAKRIWKKESHRNKGNGAESGWPLEIALLETSLVHKQQKQACAAQEVAGSLGTWKL
ncbi:hypothetical protein E2320_012043 [Naja naja]|nr:hypothetical protein E2320_012043 [Naja naja]